MPQGRTLKITHPSLAIALLLALAACEPISAPVVLVYADRPVEVAESSKGWKAVAVGGAHSCGIRTDGSLYCWGNNASGQLGVGVARGKCGRSLTECEGGPRAVASTLKFTQVSAGLRHTCALTEARALFCWGESLQFQTGIEAAVTVKSPQPVMPTFQFVDVSAGGTHTCAVRTNGVVYCWGEGSLGALGRGDSASSVFPAPIATDQHFIRVSAGRSQTCGIATDASLWCWGAEWESASGGFDFYHSRLTPHRIEGAPLLRDLSVNSSTACALTLDGAPYCWQSNAYAQLGNGTLESTGSLTPVVTSETFTGVSAGIIQSCGTTVAGVALCWGNNSFGQLGVPRPGEHCGPASLECSRVPIGVFGQQRFRMVATSFGNHTCGLTVDSAILCWGLGSEGQLGDGFARDRQSLPVGVLSPAP